MHATSRALLLSTIILVGAIAVALLVSAPHPAASDSSTSIDGYAWSDTIGWIDLNCANTGVCGTNDFGLSMDANGTVTGYAWSDNVGWISANSSDISSCESGATSRIQSGTWSGWLRAISGGSAQSGDWDGCISMSGSNYGVTYDKQTGSFQGYAWGDINVGWVDFSQASTTPQVPQCQNTQGYYCQGNDLYYRDAECNETFQQTCSYSCSNGACVPPPAPQGDLSGGAAIAVSPSIVQTGTGTVVSWSVQNVSSCSVTGTNGDSWSGASGTEPSKPIINQTIYTLSCTGLDNSNFTQTATVNIIPIFQEK